MLHLRKHHESVLTAIFATLCSRLRHWRATRSTSGVTLSPHTSSVLKLVVFMHRFKKDMFCVTNNSNLFKIILNTVPETHRQLMQFCTQEWIQSQQNYVYHMFLIGMMSHQNLDGAPIPDFCRYVPHTFHLQYRSRVSYIHTRDWHLQVARACCYVQD